MEKIPITPEGYQALDSELKQLRTVERPAIIAAIAEAREHGDLSEMPNTIRPARSRALSKAGSKIWNRPSAARK